MADPNKTRLLSQLIPFGKIGAILIGAADRVDLFLILSKLYRSTKFGYITLVIIEEFAPRVGDSLVLIALSYPGNVRCAGDHLCHHLRELHPTAFQ
jgi:hypothetical protein